MFRAQPDEQKWEIFDNEPISSLTLLNGNIEMHEAYTECLICLFNQNTKRTIFYIKIKNKMSL